MSRMVGNDAELAALRELHGRWARLRTIFALAGARAAGWAATAASLAQVITWLRWRAWVSAAAARHGIADTALADTARALRKL